MDLFEVAVKVVCSDGLMAGKMAAPWANEKDGEMAAGSVGN